MCLGISLSLHDFLSVTSLLRKKTALESGDFRPGMQYYNEVIKEMKEMNS